MFEVSDLRPTIVPKSDQLNAEQLLGGAMTVTVSDVRTGSSEQPVIVDYVHDNGRPFKPCKTMRKVLIFAWGEDGRNWIGRAMTLYNDANVKFGGEEVGGIRISHMSDIDRDLKVSLTATKGKKALHVIQRMGEAEIVSAPNVDALKMAFKKAYRTATESGLRAYFKAKYDSRMAALATLHTPAAAPTAPPGATLAQFKTEIDNATDSEAAALVLDEARDTLDATDHGALCEHFAKRWEAA